MSPQAPSWNPAHGIRLGPAPESDKSESKALTCSALGKLLGAIPAEWQLFFEVLAHSGLRISEAIGLRWKGVDFGNQRLRIRWQIYKGEGKRPKSEYGVRDVPLSHRMTQRLWEVRRQSDYRDDDHPVFASETGTPLRPANVFSRVLKPAARASGWDG